MEAFYYIILFWSTRKGKPRWRNVSRCALTISTSRLPAYALVDTRGRYLELPHQVGCPLPLGVWRYDLGIASILRWSAIVYGRCWQWASEVDDPQVKVKITLPEKWTTHLIMVLVFG